MGSNVKERNITEELVEALNKKKADFLTFNQALSDALKKRLGLMKKPTVAQKSFDNGYGILQTLLYVGWSQYSTCYGKLLYHNPPSHLRNASL